jgi:hypothetical protein
MFRMIKRMPYFKLVAIIQLALLARRHLGALTPAERKRMSDLARRGHRLTPAERSELRTLALKLEPRAFAGSAAHRMSPLPVPKWAMRVIGLGPTAASTRSR